MRDQTKLIFNMGTERPSGIAHAVAWDSMRNDIIASATRYCGGCCVHDAEGYWREDGATHQRYFTGPIAKEDALIIELTCENSKVEEVYDLMTVAIAEAVRYNRVNIDWVHVSEIPMRGRHFSVAAMNQNAAA